jgi:hypothetical protein
MRKGTHHTDSARAKMKGNTNRRTHGLRATPEYRAWARAKDRCYNPANPNYRTYGATGVRMCAEWLHDFAAFYTDMGPRPSPQHSLDRRDGWGDYSAQNCRWSTKSEQARNRRANLSREMHVTSAGLVNAIIYGERPRCRNGHVRTPENTYVVESSGARRCRMCHRDAAKKFRAKHHPVLCATSGNAA